MDKRRKHGDREQGARLREARSRRYDSVQEAAEANKWAPGTIRAHENGSQAITIEWAIDYGKAYGVDPSWILGEEVVPFVPD
jgi:hypothetical protein